MDEEKITKKIKEMFGAVFEPRQEFMILSESSQNLLLGQLQDDIIEGYLALLRDLARVNAKLN